MGQSVPQSCCSADRETRLALFGEAEDALLTAAELGNEDRVEYCVTKRGALIDAQEPDVSSDKYHQHLPLSTYSHVSFGMSSHVFYRPVKRHYLLPQIGDIKVSSKFC